ncbi:MAG: hypothetical protein HY712_07485 [candidate division NC10 bacterium]|nr:hypothetical protein [candidate division NC10 bacterium]
MPTADDQYLDVLQNIEFGIVTVYRERAEMSDYAVMRMLEALIDRYTAEKIGRPPRDFGLSGVERVLLSTVRRICEWRLGRERAPDGWSSAEGMAPEPKTVDQIILCLKRVLKSAKRWNKEGGRQGYLDFITRFVR